MRQSPRPRESEVRTTVKRDLKTDLLRSKRDLYDFAYLRNAKKIKRDLVQGANETSFKCKRELIHSRTRPHTEAKET